MPGEKHEVSALHEVVWLPPRTSFRLGPLHVVAGHASASPHVIQNIPMVVLTVVETDFVPTLLLTLFTGRVASGHSKAYEPNCHDNSATQYPETHVKLLSMNCNVLYHI